MLSHTFTQFPIDGSGLGAAALQQLAGWTGQIFLAGVVMALPLLATLLITNLAFGILTRAAPQLNLFAVGFPITLAIGFIALLITLPYYTPVLERLMDHGLALGLQLAGFPAVPLR